MWNFWKTSLRGSGATIPSVPPFLLARMLKWWLDLKQTSWALRCKPIAVNHRTIIRRSLGSWNCGVARKFSTDHLIWERNKLISCSSHCCSRHLLFKLPIFWFGFFSFLNTLIEWIRSCSCMPSHFAHVWLFNPMDCSPPGFVHGIL